jgi:ABC-2 type transport system ATP-binding protein
VARPSLDDVFLLYTGTTISDAEATASDRKRSGPFTPRRGS